MWLDLKAQVTSPGSSFSLSTWLYFLVAPQYGSFIKNDVSSAFHSSSSTASEKMLQTLLIDLRSPSIKLQLGVCHLDQSAAEISGQETGCANRLSLGHLLPLWHPWDGVVPSPENECG